MKTNRSNKKHVAVVGSLNVDLIASVRRLPGAGETVAATGLRKLFGGKGANQAVAASRQGVDVDFIGCLGGDADGRAYRQRMRDEGIGVNGIDRAPDYLTGSALIGVDVSAENLIMVAPEANGQLAPSWITKKRRLIQDASVLLLQLEVPIESVVASIRLANESGVPVVLNPSPLNEEFPWEEVTVDFLIVNETEAEQLIGFKAGTLKTRKRKWAEALGRLNVKNVVLTRGSKSTLALIEGVVVEIETLSVNPVDTVGAGDAFAGVFAASLAKGRSTEQSIRLANAAGALATLKSGAQEAIPTRHQVQRALKKQK